ncbi:hypothetical protein MRX96_014732 [Rhipicephalus microplus]
MGHTDDASVVSLIPLVLLFTSSTVSSQVEPLCKGEPSWRTLPFILNGIVVHRWIGELNPKQATLSGMLYGFKSLITGRRFRGGHRRFLGGRCRSIGRAPVVSGFRRQG